MATIGLDELWYSKITESSDGFETYGVPQRLAKSIEVDLSIELSESVLYADDAAAFVVKEFKNGTLSLGVHDLSPTVVSDLTGATIDDKGVLVARSEDIGSCVAIAFRARKPEGTYRFFWLYRVKFGVPSTSLKTKGDSIAFQTPKIEGLVMRRNNPDAKGQHPWKSEITEGAPGVSASVITGWFGSVYEPTYSTTGG